MTVQSGGHKSEVNVTGLKIKGCFSSELSRDGPFHLPSLASRGRLHFLAHGRSSFFKAISTVSSDLSDFHHLPSFKGPYQDDIGPTSQSRLIPIF